MGRAVAGRAPVQGREACTQRLGLWVCFLASGRRLEQDPGAICSLEPRQATEWVPLYSLL